MANSVQVILKKRNMLQKELIVKNYGDKQNVSRYVLRKRKIPRDLVPIWEKLLNVPEKYFVDEKGFCRELNSSEESELEDFLICQQYDVNEKGEIKGWIDEQVFLQQRSIGIKHGIKKINKRIEKDILLKNEERECNSEKEWLDEVESNLYFYENMLDIIESKKIKYYEWNSICKVLSIFMLSNNNYKEVATKKMSVMEMTIYEAICKNRKEKEKNDSELLAWYKEMWGDYEE